MALEQTRLLLSKVLDGLNKLGTGIVLKLLLWLTQDVGKDWHQLWSQLLDGGVAVLVKTDDALVDWLVLLKVLLEREDVDEDWEDLGDGDLVWVGHDHARHATRSVVQSASKLSMKKRLKGLENLVVCWEVGVGISRVLDQETGCVSSVGAGLWVLVLQAVEKELEEGSSVWGDSGLHVTSALSDDTDGGGALKVLLGRSTLHDWLLEDLPELTELGAKGDGETDDDIKSGVNNKPIVLGCLLDILLVLVITLIHLAWVLASDESGEDSGGLLEHIALSKDGWAAKTESGSNVAVDIGDNITDFMSV